MSVVAVDCDKRNFELGKYYKISTNYNRFCDPVGEFLGYAPASRRPTFRLLDINEFKASDVEYLETLEEHIRGCNDIGNFNTNKIDTLIQEVKDLKLEVKLLKKDEIRKIEIGQIVALGGAPAYFDRNEVYAITLGNNCSPIFAGRFIDYWHRKPRFVIVDEEPSCGIMCYSIQYL